MTTGIGWLLAGIVFVLAGFAVLDNSFGWGLVLLVIGCGMLVRSMWDMAQ